MVTLLGPPLVFQLTVDSRWNLSVGWAQSRVSVLFLVGPRALYRDLYTALFGALFRPRAVYMEFPFSFKTGPHYLLAAHWNTACCLPWFHVCKLDRELVRQLKNARLCEHWGLLVSNRRVDIFFECLDSTDARSSPNM